MGRPPLWEEIKSFILVQIVINKVSLIELLQTAAQSEIRIGRLHSHHGQVLNSLPHVSVRKLTINEP